MGLIEEILAKVGLRTGNRSSFISKHPGLVLCLLLTLFVVALHINNTTAFENQENRFLDLLFKIRGNIGPSDDVVILAIDDKTIGYLGNWPWGHQKLAQLVEALTYYKPSCISFTFPLYDRGKDYASGMSQLLAENILQTGVAVLPFYPTLSVRTPNTHTAPEWLKSSSLQSILQFETAHVPKASRLEIVSDLFGKSAYKSGALFSEFDTDNSVRRQPLLVRYEDKIYPSAELATAAVHLHVPSNDILFGQDSKSLQLGEIEIPADDHSVMLINYYGPPSTITTYSVKDFWDGEIKVDQIEGKIVVVGLTADGITDRLAGPVSASITPVEKSATVIDNIISSTFLTQLNNSADIELLMILFIGVMCAVILPRVKIAVRLIVLAIIAAALLTTCFVLFTSMNVILDVVYPFALLVLFALVSPILTYSPVQQSGDREHIPATSSRAADAATATPSTRNDIQSRAESEMEETTAAETVAEPDASRMDESEIRNLEEETGWQDPNLLDISDENEAEASIDVDSSPSDSISSDSTDKTGSGKLPDHFGRYEVIGELGRGAMGTVYKGRDPIIGRPVALKTIRVDQIADASEVEELKERLNREAKAAGNLSHPNIVTIYDVGQDGDTQYIAMEYLEGHTLEQIIDRKLELNFKIAAKVVLQVCSALSYAHRHNIVHRDIKPANIMVMENFHIKVMDFGIARFESSSLTQTGIAMGTPNYISPEQLKGEEVTQSSDIFSLGVVLYELLTGRKPFAGDSISNLIVKILNDEPQEPSTLNDRIPPMLDLIIRKALAKNPYDRYQSADEFSRALEDFAIGFSERRVTI